jgi:hypothetical protein
VMASGKILYWITLKQLKIYCSATVSLEWRD